MRDKILNLPCSTSPAVHRSVLDLQKIEGKGIEEKKDSRNKTDDREIIGGRKGPENAPAQKTMQEDKDTDKDTDVLNEQGGQTDTSS